MFNPFFLRRRSNRTFGFPLQIIAAAFLAPFIICLPESAAQQIRIDYIQEIETAVVDMALGPRGDVYLLHDDKTITVVDALVNKVNMDISERDTRHEVGRATSIAVDPHGTIAIGDEDGGYISLFDRKGAFVRRFGPSDNAGTQLSKPADIAFDLYGRLLVADRDGSVCLYTSQGVFLTKYPIGGKPIGVATDGLGRIYVLDEKESSVTRYDTEMNQQSVCIPADVGSTLETPRGFFVEQDGTILITDRESCTVCIVRMAVDHETSHTLSAQFGVKGKGRGEFRNPIAVLADADGYVYVADEKNRNVQIFSSATLAGTRQSLTYPPVRDLPPTVEWIADVDHSHPAGTHGLHSFTLDDEGNMYCLDSENASVSVYTWAGSYVTSFGQGGTDTGRLKEPVGIAWSDQKFLFVADTDNHRIQQWSDTGVFQRQFGKKGKGLLEFQSPSAIAIGRDGRLVIADTHNGRIQIVNQEGDVRQIDAPGGDPLHRPMAVAVDDDGNIYIVEEDRQTIRIADGAGNLVSVINDSGGDLFSKPVSVSIDADGIVYVCDAERGIVVLDADYQPVLSFGSPGEAIGQFVQPTQVHAGKGGRVYVADAVRNRISIFNIIHFFTGAVSGAVKPVPRRGQISLLRHSQVIASDSLWYDGSFFLSDMSPGEYTVQVEAVGFYQTKPETVTVVSGQIVRSRTLELEANGTIVGLLQPAVPQSRIRLKKNHKFIASAKIDEATGQFSFGEIRPGDYELDLQVQGYVSRDQAKCLTVGSGETVRDTTLLKKPGSLTGMIRPPDAAAVVTVLRDSLEIARVAVRSDDGTFEAGNLYPGIYEVLLQADRYEDLRIHDLQLNEGATFNVGQMELKVFKRSSPQSLQLLEQGKRSHLNADFERAQSIFLEAITTQEMADPDLAEAYLWLAYSYYPFPDLASQKEEALKKSIMLSPGRVLGEEFPPEFRGDFERLKTGLEQEE